MKKMVIIAFLSCMLQNFAKAYSTFEIRNLYKKANCEVSSCKKIISILSAYNETNNTLWAGYKACATMMMANYVINPYSKLSNFSKGKKLLEKCINADFNNTELRFLRFSVQTKAPAFLGYTNSIEGDKMFLLQAIKGVTDIDLKNSIMDFLKNSEYLTKSEKLKLIE